MFISIYIIVLIVFCAIGFHVFFMSRNEFQLRSEKEMIKRNRNSFYKKLSNEEITDIIIDEALEAGLMEHDEIFEDQKTLEDVLEKYKTVGDLVFYWELWKKYRITSKRERRKQIGKPKPIVFKNNEPNYLPSTYKAPKKNLLEYMKERKKMFEDGKIENHQKYFDSYFIKLNKVY